MPVRSKNSKPVDSPVGNEVTEDEYVDEVEVVVPAKPAVAKKPHKFGDCMWRRHEYCKVELEDGTKCECDCGEGHGSKYVALDLDTPLNRVFQKIVEYNKKGKMYSESEEFLAGTEAGAVVLKHEPRIIQTTTGPEPEALNVEEYDTLEELEEKRK